MESKPEEEKKAADDKLEPSLLLQKGFEKLNIDPKAPGFKEEDAIKKFQEASENKNFNFMERDFFENLIVLMKKHRFWDTQPIMHSKKKL